MVEQEQNEFYFQVTLFTLMLVGGSKGFDILRIHWGRFIQRSLFAIQVDESEDWHQIQIDILFFQFAYVRGYGWQW